MYNVSSTTKRSETFLNSTSETWLLSNILTPIRSAPTKKIDNDFERPLYKLYKYDVRGLGHAWIKNKLSKQPAALCVMYIKKNNQEIKSELVGVGLRVPHGSILGPVLFLIYTNALINCLGEVCTTVLYTDDTTILTSNKDNEIWKNVCNTNLEQLLSWFNNNRMYLNITKYNYMPFHCWQNRNILNLNLLINNELVQRATLRFFGLHVDATLSWRDYCQKL